MFKAIYVPLGLTLVLMSSGCQKSQGQHAMSPAEVGVVTIQSSSVPITTELPGRLDAVRSSTIRARATGIILKQSFEEGADVKEGDVLFQIDPAPLQASFDSAKANLAKAEAVLKQADSRAKRYTSLVEIRAVSQQENDDAIAMAAQSKAEVDLAKASMDMARLNLEYATVTSPITGRIGSAKVTEGALVSQTQATELAVVNQLDPIYFDFSQSSSDVLHLKKAFDSGKLQSVSDDQAKVVLILEDGSTYAHPGKLLFSGMSVDPTTGMINLRAEFPNPEHLLLPGMFARVKLEQAVNTEAITAPQRGVAIGPNGSATVMIVTADNKVEARPIKISTAIGDQWLVASGLKEGEKVIVEGLQKIRPGAEVKPVPFVAPAASSEAQPSPKKETHG